MKKTVLSTVITVVLCVGQAPMVHAESAVVTPVPANILIAEIQTGGASNATEEFVELYNPNDITINITGWQLQYRAASGTSAQTWPTSTTKATITCPVGSVADCSVQIAPRNRVVLTHTITNIAGALSMSGGFSGTGGEIRLIQPTASSSPLVVQDFVGYGSALDAEGLPAPAPTAGNSIKRIIADDGNVIDTQNNAGDFVAGCGEPSPGVDDSSPLPYASGCAAPPSDAQTPPSDDPQTDIPVPDEPGAEAGPLTYLPIAITELLPNPASPQQDANDEFIELYNPNDTAVTLQNYRLQTGSDYRYTFTLGDTPLGPHMYLAIPSAVSKLSLVNSGSGVRLLDPNGDTVSEVANYGDAKEGQAWMLDGMSWQWTLTPTPSAANILTLPDVKPTTTPTTPTKKKTTTAAKTTATKITAPKAASTKKATTTTSSPAAQPAAANPQYWLLLPIGAIVGGYALYEYRKDVGRLVRKSWRAITGSSKTLAPDEE